MIRNGPNRWPGGKPAQSNFGEVMDPRSWRQVQHPNSFKKGRRVSMLEDENSCVRKERQKKESGMMEEEVVLIEIKRDLIRLIII